MRGPNGEDLPDAILFACNSNSVRSPIALGLMRFLFGKFVHVESAGVRTAALNPFVTEVMAELGIDMEPHQAKAFAALGEEYFDLVISLTPEAHHNAVAMVPALAGAAEYWPTADPTLIEGNRDQRLAAFRAVRDDLLKRLEARFGLSATPAP